MKNIRHFTLLVQFGSLLLIFGAMQTLYAAAQQPDGNYEARRQWVLELFKDSEIRQSPKVGMIDALGRLYLANGQDEEALEYIAQAIHERSGGEFKYPYVSRALYMFGEHFNKPQLNSIKKAMTKKWAGDLRNHGTENHAAMRVTSQYLLAQYFSDTRWEIGKEQTYSSEQMMAEAKARILERGRNYYKFGNNEKLSSTYFSNNTYPFLTLMEYARDSEVRDAAEALLLYHISMIALNNFNGHLMPPFNRRNAVQQRFGPLEKRNRRYMPNFHRFAWLFWGQNEVIAEDFNAAGEPAYPLMYAVSDWRIPEPLNRIAKGAAAPYAIHGTIGPFGRWDVSDWIRNPDKTLRYVWRDEQYAIGGVVAQYFGPAAFNLDYHTFNITWKSSDRFRSLEVMHPYWRSNMGENYWKATHSPFQQTGVHRNTAIVLFNIPEKDPWPDRADQKHWLDERNQHFDNLIQLGQARFPATVDELVQDGDFYFFCEGNVYVAIRVLKPGHTLEKLEDEALKRHDSYSELFYVIQSREAQTGFIFEVGTAKQYGSFQTFQNKVQTNPLSVDWRTLEVRYTNTHGDELRFRYDTDMTEHAEIWDQRFIWLAPGMWINGKKRQINNWPIADSPVVTMRDSVLHVQQGGNSFTVDWNGELPQIKKNQ